MLENPHPTPHVRASARLMPARDRIVSSGMMGGVAFTLLKTGRPRPESAKQVEIRLANLPKILTIAARRAEIVAPGTGKACDHCATYGKFPPITANAPGMARFVIQNTVFALQLAQCPAGNRRGKVTQVLARGF
jgi:hypothetical protein